MKRSVKTVREPQVSPDWKVLTDLGASYLVEMSVEAWVGLPDHPRRRDPEAQARKEHWDAARAATGPVFELLRTVAAAELHSERFKVDGHARALLWQREQLPRPESVIARVYRCTSRNELNELYATFHAAHTAYNRVTGAYRECGLKLNSPRLRTGTIVDALSIAHRGFAYASTERSGQEEEFDVYAAVRDFARELKLLDSLNPQTPDFPTGIVAAALLSLAEEPRTIEFFRRFASHLGSKQAGLSDPVEAVHDQLLKVKQRKGARVRAEQEDLCARTLAAVSAWSAGPDSPGYWGALRLQTGFLTDAVTRVRELRQKAPAHT